MDATSTDANHKIASSRKAMVDLKEEAEAEVAHWLDEVFKPMYVKLRTAEKATSQCGQFTKRQRMTADRRNQEELEKLARTHMDT
ncbi:ME1 [Symbiodinium natans]|uniref:ME1 protein n=1 Tax=Symbiodinium natans TaxID=878477 RepID=A0A812SBU7_9DINO|nr:ME1 [Symbiodinium natans]